jgi:DNA polymerase-3 subunit theta
MSKNLANLSKQEMDKINVDLLAAGVAFKERYNMPVIADAVEQQQPAELREYFQQRLAHFRQASQHFSCLPYEAKSK